MGFSDGEYRYIRVLSVLRSLSAWYSGVRVPGPQEYSLFLVIKQHRISASPDILLSFSWFILRLLECSTAAVHGIDFVRGWRQRGRFMNYHYSIGPHLFRVSLSFLFCDQRLATLRIGNI